MKQNETLKKVFRVKNDNNINKLAQKLSNHIWNFDNFNNLNDKFKHFYDTVNKIYTSTCLKSTKQYTEKRLKKPWLTPEIMRLIKIL